MNKTPKIIMWVTIFLGIASIPLFLGFIPTQIEKLIIANEKYPLVGPLIVIGWRILSIIIPPLPGGLVSIALIPVFGWWRSFVYAAIAILIGTSLSFFLARRYREPFVKKFVPLKQLHEWQGKISERKQFWSFVAIRFTTGSIMDYISYIAGLSKISFRNFFLGTAVSLSSELVLYYIGERAYKYSAYAAIGAVVVFIGSYYLIKKFNFFKIKL